MKEKRYRQIYAILKSGIQKGIYPTGSYLPSENNLCQTYQITRTTVRKALDELVNDGFVDKRHGKGSQVKERRQSLGLLAVKGFSEAVGDRVSTIFLQKPQYGNWPVDLPFIPNEEESASPCIFFKRLRYVGDIPVMVESNWMPLTALDGFLTLDFINGSFFKTLSQHYQIEITGSEQELRALPASAETADLLEISVESPLLQIFIKFTTSDPGLNIYSLLHCNTERYPIGNIYNH